MSITDSEPRGVKRRLRLGTIGGLVVAAMIGSVVVEAAEDELALEGIWRPIRTREAPGQAAVPALTPPGAIRLTEPALTPEAARRQAVFEPEDDGTIQCEPFGVVRQFASSPYPMEIRRYDDAIIFRYEEWDATRAIFMDGRTFSDDKLRSLLGYSTGRYAGDALVIETNRVRENIIDHGSGIMHSRNAHISERYTLSDGGQRLNGTLTIRDPEMFEEPLVLLRSWRSAPDEEILEYGCASIGGSYSKY